MSRDRGSIFRIVRLPLDGKGEPLPNTCRHLAEVGPNGRIVRFHRQTSTNLRQAGKEGEEVRLDKETDRRVRRHVRAMKAMGFYRNR